MVTGLQDLAALLRSREQLIESGCRHVERLPSGNLLSGNHPYVRAQEHGDLLHSHVPQPPNPNPHSGTDVALAPSWLLLRIWMLLLFVCVAGGLIVLLSAVGFVGGGNAARYVAGFAVQLAADRLRRI